MRKKLIVLMDGTNNEIEQSETNILRLFRALKQTESQLIHYEPGIGTASTTNVQISLGSKFQDVRGSITGYGLIEDVMSAYRFICENHVSDTGAEDPNDKTAYNGDRIYIFGFSRGAYASRILAGFLHNFGLVEPRLLHLISPVFRAYLKLTAKADVQNKTDLFDDMEVYRGFFKPRLAPVYFLGLYDTVASILRLRLRPINVLKTLSFLRFQTHQSVSENSSVEHVRHALAIDERRSMFRPLFWKPGQNYAVNRHQYRADVTKPQDVRQVWFPGYHADVGGSVPESGSGIAKHSFAWMKDELDKIAQAEVDAGRDTDDWKPHLDFNMNYVNKYIFAKHADKTNRRNQRISAPDHAAPIHNSMGFLSWSVFWRILEVLPKSLTRWEWPGRWPLFILWYPPLSEPRPIPPGDELHPCTLERLKDSACGYNPPNLKTRRNKLYFTLRKLLNLKE